MIVLHASFYDNKLFLWGETPAESAFVPKTQRGRKLKPSGVAPFPFDPGTHQLITACRAAGLDIDAGKAQESRAVVWLPTRQSQPVASSALIAEPEASKTKTIIASWEISVLSLTTPTILNLLSACVNKQLLAPGVVIGNDVAFWVAAMRFAGNLTATQRFIPDMIQDGPNFRARWKAVLTGADVDSFNRLYHQMPHVCRALSDQETSTHPELSARVVLEQFIDQIVDNLVRQSTQLPRISTPFSDKLVIPKRSKVKYSPPSSIHDRWLAALCTPDGIIEGSQAELKAFTSQLQDWQRPIQITSSSPFKLCFKLVEPESSPDVNNRIDIESGVWNVEYLLQASADPSLFISAYDAFRNRKKMVKEIFKRNNFNAQEYLLLTLGQAAGISPRIEQSLRTSTPGGYATDATGAVEFLTETGLSLRNADFVVLYPAWWTNHGSQRKLTARASVKSPKLKAGGGLTLDAIVSFDWEIALGDERLTLKELQQLASLKAPLVRVRGEWVQLDPREIKAATDAWNRKSDKTTLRELMQMSIGAAPTAGGLPLESIDATGWIGEFFAKLESKASAKEVALPSGFRGVLRPYQSRGFAWLQFLRQWGLGACLADDMGLGKTIQALTLIESDRELGNKKPVLLICPTSVIGNWRKEAERFTPDLKVMVHHGIERHKKSKFEQEVAQRSLVISSYALLHRDIEEFKKIEWAGLILDEAQNIKNPETKQAKSARSLTAEYKIAMTGTPVENNVGDLWSIMEFLNPGFLGNQAHFKRNFFIPIQTGRDPGAADLLKRITGPFILRRLKTDKDIISDLPEKIENKVYCHLTKEQASLYEAITADALASLQDSEGIQRKGLVLATLMKLKQVCNHPAQFLKDHSPAENRSGKLTRLTEMMEELLSSGDRALLFTQFKEMGDILQHYLQENFGREVLFLHGSVSKSKRDKMVEQFQSTSGGSPIFILSLKAGGTGLNLTNANHVFHFDRWWNPAVENQATDRAFRIGQKRNVMVHKFLCIGTLEEKIDEMIEQKKKIATQVVGTGEGWLTDLSTSALKELFTLRREIAREED